MKYVYLIQSLENGYYKIGISKNPKKRMLQLKTGNSSPLELKEVYQSENARKIETGLHNFYSHNKMAGEWFDLSIADEAMFIKRCKDIDESIKILHKMGNIFV